MKRTIFIFLLSLVILYSLKSSISANQFVTGSASNIYDYIDCIERAVIIVLKYIYH